MSIGITQVVQGLVQRKLYYESVEMLESTVQNDERTKRLLRLGNVVHDEIQNSLTRTHSNRDNNRDNIKLPDKEKEINNKEKDIDFKVEGEVKIDELNVRGFL